MKGATARPSGHLALLIAAVLAVTALAAGLSSVFAQTPVQLTVQTQYADGAALSGMWTVLRSGDSSGPVVATGFSPVTFNVTPGQQYTVAVGNYQQIAFHHWDNGSTNVSRTFTLSSSATYTALYTSPDHPLPPPPGPEPVIHMQDTTVSYGVLVNSPNQIFTGEWVKPTSQLVGDSIDSITVRLARSGSPPGTFTVGVYDSQSPPQLKKSFGIVPTSSLTTEMADYEFPIPDLYTIQAGDRIGVFYNGSPGGILVMMDKVTSDSMFDGQNTQRVRYGTSWITYDVNEDLYMILKQTKTSSGGNQPPVANGQSVNVNENSSVAITLAGSDPQGQPVTFHTVNQPQHGVLSMVDQTTRRVTYTPYSYYDGTDSFTFVTNDGSSDSAPATVSITVANTAVKNTSEAVLITTELNGHSVTGMRSWLYQNDVQINEGFTHVAFDVNNNQQYTVTIADFENYLFDHWVDTGSMDRTRTISINDDTMFLAAYRTALISLAPSTGSEGTLVTVTGTGFYDTSPVSITYNGLAVATTPSSITTNLTGDFVATFAVPSWSNTGPNIVRATDGEGISATAIFMDQSVQPQAMLTISSQNMSGGTQSGFYTTLSQNGQTVATGFTPAQFEIATNQQYTVSVSNYGQWVFDHWADNGSTNPQRNVSITADTQLVAVYRTL